MGLSTRRKDTAISCGLTSSAPSALALAVVPRRRHRAERFIG